MLKGFLLEFDWKYIIMKVFVLIVFYIICFLYYCEIKWFFFKLWFFECKDGIMLFRKYYIEIWEFIVGLNIFVGFIL